MKEHTLYSALAQSRNSCRIGSGSTPAMPLLSLSWCPMGSALQCKAGTSAIITLEVVIISHCFCHFLSVPSHSYYSNGGCGAVHYSDTAQREKPSMGNKGSSFSTSDFNHHPHTAVAGSSQNQRCAESLFKVK